MLLRMRNYTVSAIQSTNQTFMIMMMTHTTYSFMVSFFGKNKSCQVLVATYEYIDNCRRATTKCKYTYFDNQTFKAIAQSLSTSSSLPIHNPVNTKTKQYSTQNNTPNWLSTVNITNNFSHFVFTVTITAKKSINITYFVVRNSIENYAETKGNDSWLNDAI